MKALLLVVLTGLVGCQAETIITASDRKAAEGGDDAGLFDCKNNDDCGDDEYCAKQGCDPETRGRCTLRPPGCGSEDQRVCGCDGVTYFNDCLRRQNGMGLRAAQECDQDPLRCGGPDEVACPSGSECALFIRGRPPPPPLCPVDLLGECWALPTECSSQPMGGDRYTPCGQVACLDLCSVIRTGIPAIRVNRCEP